MRPASLIVDHSQMATGHRLKCEGTRVGSVSAIDPLRLRWPAAAKLTSRPNGRALRPASVSQIECVSDGPTKRGRPTP